LDLRHVDTDLRNSPDRAFTDVIARSTNEDRSFLQWLARSNKSRDAPK
jgi:hypothetical protein